MVGTNRGSFAPPNHPPELVLTQAAGGVFFTGGVVMFFDRAMLAMGNVRRSIPTPSPPLTLTPFYSPPHLHTPLTLPLPHRSSSSSASR